MTTHNPNERLAQAVAHLEQTGRRQLKRLGEEMQNVAFELAASAGGRIPPEKKRVIDAFMQSAERQHNKWLLRLALALDCHEPPPIWDNDGQYALQDDGYAFKKIMLDGKWVGRVEKTGKFYSAFIGTIEGGGATEITAFRHATRRHAWYRKTRLCLQHKVNTPARST